MTIYDRSFTEEGSLTVLEIPGFTATSRLKGEGLSKWARSTRPRASAPSRLRGE